MSELASIPPPPRRVRWSTALRHRWLLAVPAGVLLAVSLLLAAILAIRGVDLLLLHDDVLDAESRIADGEVVAVEPSGIQVGRTDFDRLRFRYDTGTGTVHEGLSFAPVRDGYRAGQAVRVEYAPNTPDIGRVRGTRRNPIAVESRILLGFFLLPSLGLLLWWLRGAARIRLLLADGRLTLARVGEVRPIFGVNPPQLRVTFDWVDRTGGSHRASHWVGRRSALGARIVAGVESIPAVVDDAQPARARLVHSSDFPT